MKLSDWLAERGMKRQDFARLIGVSPATITALCNSETAWLSRETAEAILRETNGAVTPNDFIGVGPGPDDVAGPDGEFPDLSDPPFLPPARVGSA